MKRWNTKTGKTKQNRDIHRQRLLLCGDIELIPGAVTNYKNITNVFSHYKKKLKFFHVNCQSMVKKNYKWKPSSEILEITVYMDTQKLG